ncbi:hypothetical protein P8452_14711 [Trifolium repens]|nr:hypothetical protein P8452_14711 [Trifolium repens]
MFSVFHPSEDELTSSIIVWFLPVPDNSLSSDRYYVLRAKGRHKGNAYVEFLGKLRYNNLEGGAGEDYRFRGGR